MGIPIHVVSLKADKCKLELTKIHTVLTYHLLHATEATFISSTTIYDVNQPKETMETNQLGNHKSWLQY
jgi:hypothetical protein